MNVIYLFFLLNKLKEVSTCTILKDDPEMVPCLVPVEEAQYMPVFKVMKDTDLNRILLAKKANICVSGLTSFRTFLRRLFSTDLTATYSIVFFLRPY